MRDRLLLMTPDDSVLAGYADAARRAAAGEDLCADASPFGAATYGDGLGDLPEAATRASLGCGNPVDVVDLRPGETVLDLGSGGGIDVLLSARRVGPSGLVYGLDATVEMLDLARRNVVDAGATSVELLHGVVEQIPLGDAAVDVVISNCVIVVSTDKDATFAEIARVLRPGGRVGICDIVRSAPDDGTPTAVSCAAGAITPRRYEDALRGCGLGHVSLTLTDPIGAGLSNAIIRATKPATISPASDRRVDGGVAETSVHVHPDEHGRDIGTDLSTGWGGAPTGSVSARANRRVPALSAHPDVLCAPTPSVRR